MPVSLKPRYGPPFGAICAASCIGPICAATVCTSLANAQPATPPTLLDPIVVTAARAPQQLDQLTADVTVIGPEEIARAGAQGLVDLLQRQPGVQIVTSGGPGSTTSVFLRSANANQTLVLIDGLRVSSSSTGTTPFEAIPLDQIDHIEILRGPAASLYGADAIGGVIQVFTRNGAGTFAANASAGYGTFNTSQFTAGAAGGGGPWRFMLQGGYNRSAGFSAIGNPANASYNPDNDGYRNGSASGSLAYSFAAEQVLSAQAFYSRMNAQFDGSADFDDRTITTLQSYLVASRNRLTSFWKSTLEAGVSIDDSNTQTSFGPSQFKTTQQQYTWQNDFTLPQGTLSLALTRREERLDTDAGFAVTSRNTNAIVGVYQLQDGPNSLQANLRRDDSSQYGGQTSGSLAYAYTILPGLRASASYGTGFKAPTFNDLYYPGFSNPGLVPETARNFEAALRYASSEINAGIVAYRNRVSNLIVFECDANFNCAPQNIADATLEGVTLEWQAVVRDTTVKGSVDFARPYDDATGNLLPRRARRYGTLDVTQAFGPVQAGVQVVASSARYDDAADTRRMGGYAIVNLNAAYALAPRWTLFAVAGNIFNKHYELSADYNTIGANLFAGVRYRF
jgi:vitamin B12 transporter